MFCVTSLTEGTFFENCVKFVSYLCQISNFENWGFRAIYDSETQYYGWITLFSGSECQTNHPQPSATPKSQVSKFTKSVSNLCQVSNFENWGFRAIYDSETQYYGWITLFSGSECQTNHPRPRPNPKSYKCAKCVSNLCQICVKSRTLRIGEYTTPKPNIMVG